jgi:GNAT superfamily N-acetyltransferase
MGDGRAGNPDVSAVRRVVAEDWSRFRSVRLRALTDEPECFGTGLEHEMLLAEQMWVNSLSSDHWFAAGVGLDIVGLVGFFPSDRYPDGAPQLGSMWVHPAHRGRGMAAALEGAVATHARSVGATRLGLWVTDGNDRALRVYEQLGYSRTGAQKPAPRDGAVLMARMTRELRPADSSGSMR